MSQNRLPLQGIKYYMNSWPILDPNVSKEAKVWNTDRLQPDFSLLRQNIKSKSSCTLTIQTIFRVCVEVRSSVKLHATTRKFPSFQFPGVKLAIWSEGLPRHEWSAITIWSKDHRTIVIAKTAIFLAIANDVFFSKLFHFHENILVFSRNVKLASSLLWSLSEKLFEIWHRYTDIMHIK